MAEKLSFASQIAPTWLIPDYPPLKSSDDVGKAAMNGQVVEYPQVVRKMVDPPINGQKYGNVSFMLFDQPKMLNNKPVYGYVKLRGNHESEETARADSYRIVRDVDSKFMVLIAPVGWWVPITESDTAIKEKYDVREDDKEILLRDEAVKEKEKKQAKIVQEIRDNEEKLKTGGDIYDNPESLTFYAMKRVTEMTLMETRKAQQEKIDHMQKKIAEQRIILKRLEEKYPDYSKEWIAVYNEERAKSGTPKFIPGEKQFDDYESSKLEDLLSTYGDHKPEAIGKSSLIRNEALEKDPLIENEETLKDVSDVIMRTVKSTSKK